MSFTISELSPVDIPQACELFHRVFGHPITPDQWLWKYTDGPRLGSLNWVARDPSGNMVGHAGATVFAGTAGGVAVSMAQVCDVMVDKIARGGGNASNVYPQLMRVLQASIADRFIQPYAYGFSGLRPYKLGHRLGLYQERQHCRPGYFVPLEAPNWRTSLWAIRQSVWSQPTLDTLWARHLQMQTSPIVQRTGAYLNWRYHKHPSHNYKLWVLSRLGSDQGWLVTREMPSGHICIVDTLLPPKAKIQSLVQKLYKVLNPSTFKTPTESSPLYAWFLPNQDTPPPEPIIASEVLLGAWQTHHGIPSFQPGDTDVF